MLSVRPYGQLTSIVRGQEQERVWEESRGKRIAIVVPEPCGSCGSLPIMKCVSILKHTVPLPGHGGDCCSSCSGPAFCLATGVQLDILWHGLLE